MGGLQVGRALEERNATSVSPTWTRLDHRARSRWRRPVLPPDHHLTARPRHVFVTLWRLSTGNVWKSDDRGATWINIGAALPAAPVRAVTLHPTQPHWLYVGTEVGVFASEDVGDDLGTDERGPGQLSVDDLFWWTALICITHGRGMFKLDLSVPMV